MAVMRSVLLAASQNAWLRQQAPRYRFVRSTVSRFMPGEDLEDALRAAQGLQQKRLRTVLTYLGENVTLKSDAQKVADHYIHVLARVRELGLPTEVSVKLTHLGLDLDPEFCYGNLERIIQADTEGTVWIDMEQTNYVDATLDIFRRARKAYPNVGVCVQAYLRRTAADLESLIPLGPSIRLVKGAYKEPPDRAFPVKADVDENYFKLAQMLLSPEARATRTRAAFATHDRNLIGRIQQHARSKGIGNECYEFQMLYGIQRSEQERLAREGQKCAVLISYGSYWFPWFMRRLAERPANLTFVLRNMFS